MEYLLYKVHLFLSFLLADSKALDVHFLYLCARESDHYFIRWSFVRLHFCKHIFTKEKLQKCPFF